MGVGVTSPGGPVSRLCASNAGNLGLISGRGGIQIPHATSKILRAKTKTQHNQINTLKKQTHEIRKN